MINNNNRLILVLIVLICCLIHLIRAQSSESSSDYDQEEDDEFRNIGPQSDQFPRNPKGMMMMGMMGRAKEPDDDEGKDEFENFNEEFDKDNFKMEAKGKNKDDIEFAIQFEENKDSKEDNSKEKDYDEGGKDAFYQQIKDELDEDHDFNMYSSNKMDKRIKCDNPLDCEMKMNQSSGLNNKTTIIFMNNNPTTSLPNSFSTSQFRYPQRQYEEATNLKAEHHDDDDYLEKPLNCDCDVKIQPKIIGGSNAPKNKYPFAVAIFTLVGRGSFCGASIVNELYILTASHCVQRWLHTPRNYNIVAGRTDLNVSDITEEQITKASHIWLNGRLNDVALVKLSQPLEFSSHIKPACFAGPNIFPRDYSYGYSKFGFDNSHFNNQENVSKHFKKTNRTVTAIGWGYTGWKVSKVKGIPTIRPKMTTKLQEVELNEVICTKEEYLICVQGKEKSPCFGDSGSPLLYNFYDKMVAVGLTSRSASSKGRYCLGEATIYERVSYYLPWIKTLTSNRICLVD